MMKKEMALVLTVVAVLALGCIQRKVMAPLAPATLMPSNGKLHADAANRLYYPVPDADKVRYASYSYAEGLSLDLYYPPTHDAAKPVAVVVIANGLDDSLIKRK
jgi:hypothetical protein